MVFKNLESSDILISPFEVHKTFTLNDTDSGSGLYSFQITKGTDATQYGWNVDDADKTEISASTFYSLPNYYVINNMFYRDLKQMYEVQPFEDGEVGIGYVYVEQDEVDYISAVPTSSDAVLTYTETRNLYDTPNDN